MEHRVGDAGGQWKQRIGEGRSRLAMEEASGSGGLAKAEAGVLETKKLPKNCRSGRMA